MKEERGRVPDLILEQFALGELPPEEEESLRSAIASDPSIRARLDEIGRSNAEILAEHPPADMAARILARLEDGSSGKGAGAALRFRPSFGVRAAAALARRAAIPAAAAFIVLAGALAFRGALGTPSSDVDTTRAKGSAAGGAARAGLHVFRKTPTGSEELSDGAIAARRDLLQLSYSSGGARYGTILSIDGRGSITFHLPPAYSGGKAQSPELDSRPGTALGSAYELDDAPSYERFFLVVSPKPFALAEVYAEARKLAARSDAASAPLPLPPSLGQSSFIVIKQGSGR